MKTAYFNWSKLDTQINKNVIGGNTVFYFELQRSNEIKLGKSAYGFLDTDQPVRCYE